ncbi:MAG: hypothetical protein OEW83_19575, partial [Acidimicrobiia bacterium]|nr:hypothetical protein [Acidimicrobiia bacterium]
AIAGDGAGQSLDQPGPVVAEDRDDQMLHLLSVTQADRTDPIGEPRIDDMVGRMIREAVENMIDDVKESIEEQGRQVQHAGRVQRPGPMPRLQAPPPPFAPPSVAPSPAPPSASSAVAPPAPTPTRAPSPAAPSKPDRPAAPETVDVDEGAAFDSASASVDSVEDPNVEPDGGTAPELELETIARLEADVETARELYRDARDDLREARRAARLAARDDRKNRRHERRLRPEIDQRS